MEEATLASINTRKALKYIDEVKGRVGPDVYQQFVDILMDYLKYTKSAEDVHIKVQSLFRNYPKLLEDFQTFLPQSELKSGFGTEAAGSEVVTDDAK